MFQSTASLNQSLTTLNGEDESNSPERFREAERKSKPSIKMTAKPRIVFHEMAARSLVADHIQPAKRINVTSATAGETTIIPSKPSPSQILALESASLLASFLGASSLNPKTNPYKAIALNVIKYGSRI